MKIKLPTHGFRAMAICLILFACLFAAESVGAERFPFSPNPGRCPRSLYNPGLQATPTFCESVAARACNGWAYQTPLKVSPPQATCHSRCLPTSVSELGVTLMQESFGLFSNLLINARGATNSNFSREARHRVSDRLFQHKIQRLRCLHSRQRRFS